MCDLAKHGHCGGTPYVEKTWNIHHAPLRLQIGRPLVLQPPGGLWELAFVCLNEQNTGKRLGVQEDLGLLEAVSASMRVQELRSYAARWQRPHHWKPLPLRIHSGL